MISSFLAKLNAWLVNDETRRREAYLATSSDLVELESRIRALDNGQYRSL
jgi:hypothetical protein